MAETEQAPREFSIAERDRRWNAVRENAAAAGFDCILVPLCVDGRNLNQSPEQSKGTRADCRYLTMMENAAVIMPTDGRAPIVVNDRGVGNSWIPEARATSRGPWGPVIADGLIEAGMEHARIGVSGLQAGKVSHVRSASGVVNHGTYVEIRDCLPDARFEDATDVIGFARYVKGEEEIAALRRAAQIAAAGIKTMIDVARPGTPTRELYAQVVGRMLELGSEQYPLALDIGPLTGEQHRWEEPPVGLTLEKGQLIINEVDAVWLGLVAQEDQPILLGPMPDVWRPVVELQGELYRTGLEVLRPGASFADLIGKVSAVAERGGMQGWSMLHSRGYGNDGPLVNNQDGRSGPMPEVEVKANTVWMWKPTAATADGWIRFRWGGCILITEQGAEPLVPRKPGLVTIQ